MHSRSLHQAFHSPWLRYAAYLAYLTLAAGALYAGYADWAYDDPYIAYRYVRNLVSGAGFVYNPGERVLSTTTPLYVLVLAAVSPLSVDLPRLSILIGCVCLACGGLLLWDLSRSWNTPLVGWAGLALYPGFPLLAATLGSEMPFYLALCLAAIAAYARRGYSLAAIFSALATLARPDGVLLALLLAVHYLIWVRKPLPWRSIAWYAVITLPWFAFAWVYFGTPLPVTLAAKQYQGAMLISQRFALGFLTTFTPFLRRPYFWIELTLAGLGLVFSIWTGRRWLLLWAWAALYFAGYSLLGVSRYFWYYAPLVPVFIAAVGLGLTTIYAWLASSGRLNPTAGSLLAGLALTLLFLGQTQSLIRQAQLADLRYPIFRSVGEWLAANTPPGSSVGALEIGVIGYYANRPVVDFAGLVQPDVAPQLQGRASYEDAALWAMQRYRPDYLVLREKLFPGLEAGYVAQYCHEVHKFPIVPGAYPWLISIYACPSGN